MKKACYPGSFDPITNGHIEIVQRALALFDKVVFIVANNSDKRYTFSLEERTKMIIDAFKADERIEVVSTSGLVVAKAKELGSDILLRGLRAVTDFEYEFQIAAVNEYIDYSIETVFLMSRRENAFISSSHVKELYKYGTDISKLVPKSVIACFEKKKAKDQTER